MFEDFFSVGLSGLKNQVFFDFFTFEIKKKMEKTSRAGQPIVFVSLDSCIISSDSECPIPVISIVGILVLYLE